MYVCAYVCVRACVLEHLGCIASACALFSPCCATVWVCLLQARLQVSLVSCHRLEEEEEGEGQGEWLIRNRSTSGYKTSPLLKVTQESKH